MTAPLVVPELPEGASIAAYAAAYAAAGLPIAKIAAPAPAGGCTCSKGLACGKPGKHPLARNWQAGLRPEEVRQWGGQACNVGLVMGGSLRLVALDVDGAVGRDSLAALEAEHGPLPETATSISGREDGGMHLLFQVGADLDLAAIKNAVSFRPGLDVRATGGQIVAPPSLHRSGRAYRWTRTGVVAELPRWMFDVMTAPKVSADTSTDHAEPPRTAPRTRSGAGRPSTEAREKLWAEQMLAKLAAKVASTTTGSRNAAARDAALIAGHYAPRYLSVSSIERAVFEACEHNGAVRDDGADAARTTIKNAIRDGMTTPKTVDLPPDANPAPPGAPSRARTAPQEDAEHDQEHEKHADRDAEPLDPWRYHPTDIGNGERLVAQHGRDLHYCGPWGAWLVWDGQRWQEDRHFEVQRRAKATAIGIYREASAIVGHEERHELRRKALSSWAKKSESTATREAMISSALSEPGISVTPEELDADSWALNVQNGTLDLRTGTLRKHRREDKNTKIAAVAFDPEAKCPIFLEFLRTIMRGDEELIALLQRFFGYALTGEIREHVLLNCFGAGSNGKSTLLGVFVALLGEYAYQAPPDLLLVKKGETHPTDQAGLYGKRLAVCMETPKGRAMDTTRMKALTGGDRITARRMREDFWTFAPTHKLVIGTNHRPAIETTDHGTWRRQKLVPFAVQIPDEKQDRELPAKLLAEGPGILRWAVEGCLAWQRQGLGDAAAVREATKAWRDESDPLRAFLAARCEEGPGFTVETGELYAAYLDFIDASDGVALSQTALGGRLTERGIVSAKGPKGVRLRVGLRLTPQNPQNVGGGWRVVAG